MSYKAILLGASGKIGRHIADSFQTTHDFIRIGRNGPHVAVGYTDPAGQRIDNSSAGVTTTEPGSTGRSQLQQPSPSPDRRQRVHQRPLESRQDDRGERLQLFSRKHA